MTAIDAIVMHPPGTMPGGLPDVNPLTEQDALLEVQLLDLRICAVASTVAVLLELRTSLHLRGVNTGLLVVRGVRELSWLAERRTTARTAWNIVSSVPERTAGSFTLDIGCIPMARLKLVSDTAEFYAGNVAGLDSAPPDYVADSDATIAVNLPGWGSDLALESSVFSEF